MVPTRSNTLAEPFPDPRRKIPENRIVSVDAGAPATYIYDARGSGFVLANPEIKNGYRVRQTGYTEDTCSSDGIRDFGYNIFGEQTLEHNSNGTGCRQEIYAGSRHIATYAGETIFNHADWLGNERYRSYYYTTNYHQSCTNLPFGDALSCSAVGGGDPSPMHFTGRVSGFVLANPELNNAHDFETGVDCFAIAPGSSGFGARYNSSQLGRFMTPDPSGILTGGTGNPLGLNLYSYVENNPVNAVDPDGLDCVYINGNSVGVVRGDCLSDTDNGIFINGTIDTKSGSYDPSTGTLSFNYTNDDTGAIGKGVISGVYPSGGISDADRFNAVVRGMQIATPGVNLAAAGLRTFGYIVAAPLMVAAECAAGADSCTKGNVAMALVPVIIPESAPAHVLEGHSATGALTAGKSVFNAGEDIKGLIQAAESAPAKSAGNILIRTVDAGRAVGIDRSTGQVTSVHTVITKNTGELITAYPGRP
jgi:RHS repeat-associated protein